MSNNPQMISGYLQRVWLVYPEYYRKGDMRGVYLTKKQAEEEAKGIGEWGGDGSIKEGWAIVMDGHVGYVLDCETEAPTTLNVNFIKEKKRRRETALAKLTDEDKEALGLA